MRRRRLAMKKAAMLDVFLLLLVVSQGASEPCNSSHSVPSSVPSLGAADGRN